MFDLDILALKEAKLRSFLSRDQGLHLLLISEVNPQVSSMILN